MASFKILIVIIGLFLNISICTNIFPGENSDSGFIPVKNGEIYYLLFRSRHNSTSYPLVFWHNGGPGCPSLLGAFYENGPYKFDGNNNLIYNPFSWNVFANIVYVDQPVNVGLSTANKLPFSQREATEDLYQFIIGFFEKYTEFKGRYLFITGESHGGHYIPSIAQYIIEHPHPYLNLKGIAIGDGEINAYYQLPSYSQFAFDNKMISWITYELTSISFKLCQFLIKYSWSLLAFAQCKYTASFIQDGSFNHSFNIYDIRLKEDYYQPGINNFLMDPQNRKEMNVTNQFYKEYSYIIYVILTIEDYFTNYSEVLSKIIEKGVNVMMYTGEYDFICNWNGAEEWVKNMVWSGQSEFNKQAYKDWKYNNETFGIYKLVNNFAFVKIFNAGHMVPMDQPEYSLNMFLKFLNWDIGN